MWRRWGYVGLWKGFAFFGEVACIGLGDSTRAGWIIRSFASIIPPARDGWTAGFPRIWPVRRGGELRSFFPEDRSRMVVPRFPSGADDVELIHAHPDQAAPE